MHKWELFLLGFLYEIALLVYILKHDTALPSVRISLFQLRYQRCLWIHYQILICGPCGESLASVMAELCEACLSV